VRPEPAAVPAALPADSARAEREQVSTAKEAELPARPSLPVQPARRDFARADAAIRAAIARGVTPGAVLAAGGRDGFEYIHGYGALDHAGAAPAAADSSIYDLASLTKVVATTTAVMLLVDEGRMGLDDPLHRHLSAWPRGGWRDR
jgi:serine-type D-Ala-D-Ala carboxypeptidase